MAYDWFLGNSLYGKILTKKEPINSRINLKTTLLCTCNILEVHEDYIILLKTKYWMGQD